MSTVRIRHYGLNAFIIEDSTHKLAIDPGNNVFGIKRYSLIPKPDWEGVSHILVTHGDPDHFKYAVPMARDTGAEVICGTMLADDLLSEGITNVHQLGVGEQVSFKGLTVRGLKTKHGPLMIRFGHGLAELKLSLLERSHGGKEIFLASKRVYASSEVIDVRDHGTIKLLFGLIRLERDNIGFARGSIGFEIEMGDKTLVNLGDTMLQKEWEGLRPDVVMIPIGGKMIRNTMDETEALDAVNLMKPARVIPCHYVSDFLLRRNVVLADADMFKREVESMGVECTIMKRNDEISLR